MVARSGLQGMCGMWMICILEDMCFIVFGLSEYLKLPGYLLGEAKWLGWVRVWCHYFSGRRTLDPNTILPSCFSKQ